MKITLDEITVTVRGVATNRPDPDIFDPICDSVRKMSVKKSMEKAIRGQILAGLSTSYLIHMRLQDSAFDIEVELS